MIDQNLLAICSMPESVRLPKLYLSDTFDRHMADNRQLDTEIPGLLPPLSSKLINLFD